jgi:hypothetical protein
VAEMTKNEAFKEQSLVLKQKNRKQIKDYSLMSCTSHYLVQIIYNLNSVLSLLSCMAEAVHIC